MQESIVDETIKETQVQTTAIIIANPTSGSYIQNKQQIEETVDYLRNNGWLAEIKLTEAAGDARRLTQEAVVQHVNVVVAVGGDGTINEIIQELANSETALGLLPSGTINVWARETGIPLQNEGAREVLVHGRTRVIDLGRMNERYFLLMTGIGFDGEVTHAIEQKPIKRFGVLAYALIGTVLGIGYPSFQIVMQMGGRTLRTQALQVIIGNTQLYAGTVKFTWQAKCDDGLLDVCVVRKRTLLGLALVVLDFVLRRARRRREVIYETCDSVKVHTNRPVGIQVDGEPDSYTVKEGVPPTTFIVAPNALKVIVPLQTSKDLFSKE